MDRGAVAALDHCYLTTTGRRTGRPHTIEIWFALEGDRVYLLSGGGDRSDWVRNLREHPTVGLRLGEHDFLARADVVEGGDEDALARRLLFEKYAPRTDEDLEEWRREALVVAIDLPATA
ncbi:MAG: nitroreductase family deazaflavin-dependent oxidoreductase [Actinomycetota bacterium]